VHLSILANQETSPTPQCHSGQLEDTTHFEVMHAIGDRGADRIVRSHFGKHAQPHLWITHAAAFGDHPSFPNLAKFACNILPLLASGCKVEREFSVLGKITMWQWSSLSTSTNANSMMCGKNLCGIWLPLTENQKFNADLYALEVY